MKNSFNNNFRMQVKQDLEKKNENLKLKRKYENGKVLEKDLSNVQKSDLKKLYDEQIMGLMNKVNQKKKEIEEKDELINKYFELFIKR